MRGQNLPPVFALLPADAAEYPLTISFCQHARTGGRRGKSRYLKNLGPPGAGREGGIA
jgi:hypothetical protein